MKMKTCFQHKGWIPQFTLLTVIFSFVAASTTSGQKVLIRAVGESLQFPTSVPVSGDIEFKGSTIGTVFNKQTDINLTEEFKNRLHWNSQSGLFTLSDLRMEDSGVYKLESTKKPRITQYHQLNVYDKVSAPRVTNTTTNSSSENKLCSLLCSVKNVKEMNLCWIKSSVILKQTYSSNYNDTVHLPLEIQQRDHDKYSCVASNPVSNQTAVIYIKELCQISAGSRGVQSLPGIIGRKAGIHLGGDASPSQGNTDTHTHIHSHTHTYRHFRVANPPATCVFGLWEETGAPGGNPRGHGENTLTPHS
ncbi:SLAM family member 5-like isoform X5 [Hoplias malabaricus]|uniref:SLAM family member 5-like isoform X5 n=1 Tax=Hoplias malabaricus TaxID=27720 RepID=UPI003462488D